MIERLQSEPPVQQEGLYASLCPQSMMTSEGDDSRTYASIDKSTREAKDVEYEIPVPTQRIQQKPFVQREGVYTTLCPEPMMAPEGEDSRTCKSTVEDSDIEYVIGMPNPEYVNQIPDPKYMNQITSLEYVNA
ncbi:uncharacterized protein [Pocillopora verrucosa]|uniref:uncharacterized protein n=1 Tax=Pocillopora verrucosa TaxID=203993 RepID=UPI00333EAECB